MKNNIQSQSSLINILFYSFKYPLSNNQHINKKTCSSQLKGFLSPAGNRIAFSVRFLFMNANRQIPFSVRDHLAEAQGNMKNICPFVQHNQMKRMPLPTTKQHPFGILFLPRSWLNVVFSFVFFRVFFVIFLLRLGGNLVKFLFRVCLMERFVSCFVRLGRCWAHVG